MAIQSINLDSATPVVCENFLTIATLQSAALGVWNLHSLLDDFNHLDFKLEDDDPILTLIGQGILSTTSGIRILDAAVKELVRRADADLRSNLLMGGIIAVDGNPDPYGLDEGGVLEDGSSAISERGEEKEVVASVENPADTEVDE